MERKVQRTLGEIAGLVGGVVSGDPSLVVAGPVPAGSDDSEGITFAADEKYLSKALDSGVGAIIAWADADLAGRPGILVEDPRRAFGALLAMSARPLRTTPGTHPTAVVSPDASLGEGCSVGAYVVVDGDADIGAGCVLMPFAYVGPGCRLGAGTVLMPHAVLVQDVRLGTNCIVHPGAVLGADGFGFVWDGTKQIKVPQVGGVAVGDDVEIGANTCVDRATCGDTSLASDVKLDDLVMVAHNVSIGRSSVVASLAGVAGSSSIGARVTVGGQVAIADHVAIGDDIALGGRTGVMNDMDEPGVYLGTPATQIKKAIRIMALSLKLPELFQRVRELEESLKRPRD